MPCNPTLIFFFIFFFFQGVNRAWLCIFGFILCGKFKLFLLNKIWLFLLGFQGIGFQKYLAYYDYMDRVKRIWFLSPMRAAKVQASLRIGAVSPEPSLLAHTSSESRGAFRQKARALAPLNGWAYAVKICHDGMLEDTNSLDGAHIMHLMCPFWMSLQLLNVVNP